MLKLRQAIVVEGKYDKITLSQLVDAPIFVTNGFGIFRDEALISVLRRTAETRGLVILTDSDGGGLVIRSRLSGCLPKQGVLMLSLETLPPSRVSVFPCDASAKSVKSPLIASNIR